MITTRINRTWGSMLGVLVVAVIICTGYVGYRVTHRPATQAATAVPQNTDPYTGKPLVIMIAHYTGGLCAAPSGGGVCENTYRLFSNGTFEYHTALTPEELSQLRATIDATDFMAYKQQTTGTCPSAYDGLDLRLEFPLKYSGQKLFMPCRLQIPKDDNGIRYIEEMITKHELQG